MKNLAITLKHHESSGIYMKNAWKILKTKKLWFNTIQKEYFKKENIINYLFYTDLVNNVVLTVFSTKRRLKRKMKNIFIVELL